ncbi:hypothetical protein RND71_031205 [Anisodus tanguticus]|uniref:Uncharacterized protein n=1 Tax=Anisodus tanguticus TaxID=243964 RepID=A0AAE1RB83_9SOLA|nr:hypothetical protein RND71_031205 [Anisodus tanguticus]
MFKLQKQNNKEAKSGERVDFRFSTNFQALQVLYSALVWTCTSPSSESIRLEDAGSRGPGEMLVPKGWDRLSLSIICVETGKTVAKLAKTLVKNGSCQWPETLLESVWISQDDSSSLELEESLYKFVVSMVKIHCLTPTSKFRDESKSTGSSMKQQGLDHDHVSSKSNESENNFSAGSDVLPSTYDVDSNSGPSKFEIKIIVIYRKGSLETLRVTYRSQERNFSASRSNNSFSSAESFTQKEKATSRNHTGKQVRASAAHTSPQNDYFIDDHSVSNRSSYNTKATGIMEHLQNNGKDFTTSSQTNSASSRNLLEAAEDTIEELRIEAKMWERNARKLMLDLDILREDFSAQSKKQADLESKAKHDMAEDLMSQPKGQNHVQEELENEIRHQQELNDSLVLQLKGSQESNVELVMLLQELEETIEQQKFEIEKFSSLHLRLTDMQHSATAASQEPENNAHSQKASIELIRDVEALREKVHELERDCAELTQENLELLIKFKESGSESTLAPVEKVGKNENSEEFIKLVKQLEVAFHHLKRPCYKISSRVSDQCKHHLENLANLSDNSTGCVLAYLFDLNNLLETRIVECDEHFKQHEQEIQERNKSLAEAQRKLDDYSLEVQAHEGAKAELQVQCSGLLKELDQKNSEMEKLQADLQAHEEEKTSLLEHKRELEGKVADLQKEKDQVEENMKIVLRESAISSRCLDDLQNDHKLLERKLAQLESEKQTLEDQLVGLTEKNENMEAQIRLMTVERESCQSALEESRSIVLNLQDEIEKLESETKTNVADLKEELENMQILWSQAREECGYLTNKNEKLEESLQNVERKNVEQHEHRVKLETQLHESQKSLANSLIKVKALEENLDSMWKDLSLKDERMNAELNVLIQQNKNEIERYSEKLMEVESLEKEVQQLTKQISEMDEGQRLVSDAVHEVSSWRADKEKLESALEDVQSKFALNVKELAVTKLSYEKLLVEHAKILKLLPNYRANEEKLKTAINDLELQLTLSRYEHQKLHEESANLKFQLQKTKELQDEVFNLKSELTGCMFEKEKLEASLELISKDCEEMKAEKASFAGKISELQKVLSELENSNRKRVFLEEKIEQLESDLTEKEKFCAQVGDLENELSETKGDNEQYRQKACTMEEEKDICLRKVHAHEAEVKMMEEEKKLYAKKVSLLRNSMLLGVFKKCCCTRVGSSKNALLLEDPTLTCSRSLQFEQNDTPKSNSRYTNFNRAPQKLSQSQELLVDRLHSDRKCSESEGENGFSDGNAPSIEMDYLARIQLLENKLAEALEANKKYKIQFQRFKTEERKGHSPASNKSDWNSEMVKRFEHTKALLETELKDIRERYFQMSLKYAEVEAQREDLVMKLKAVKSGKRWFS